MNIRLEKINKENFEEAVFMKRGKEHDMFVAENVYSIAEGQFYNGINCYAAYMKDKMVGFAMFGSNYDAEDGDTRFWIWRLMIAEGERGKGYGRAVMDKILEKAKKENHQVVGLSTEPNNIKGINLYKSLGFKTTGEQDEGEDIYICKL